MFILCLFNPLYYTYWDIYISDFSLGFFVKIYYMVYFNIVYCWRLWRLWRPTFQNYSKSVLGDTFEI